MKESFDDLLDIEQTRGAVVRRVNTAKQLYIKHYGMPRFVKVPVIIYERLKLSNIIYDEVCSETRPEMLMGLIVCPTYSIEHIEEIEVF